jgi:2-methylisocitrate lyase-like PEP mutase family enzyme
MTTEPTAAFRALHHGERPLLLPNAWDFASAAALLAAGFAAIGTTSLGVAAAHGLPDGQGAGREESLALARLLGRLPCLFTVDIEAGFSDDPDEVADLAAALRAAGAVGINLEDGSPDGTLADPGRQQALIATVKAAVPDLFVNARVDAYWLGGDDPSPLATTLPRAAEYVAAGADGIFVPGVTRDSDIATLVDAIPAPLNVLFLPGKHSVERLAGLGVARISTGSLLFRTAIRAAVQTAEAVRDGEPTAAAYTYARIQQLVAGAGAC